MCCQGIVHLSASDDVRWLSYTLHQYLMYRILKAAESEAAVDAGMASDEYLLVVAFTGQRVLPCVRSHLPRESTKGTTCSIAADEYDDQL